MANDLGKLDVPFYVHMRKLVDMKEQLDQYFRYRSKAWKAIRDYVVKELANNALVDHPHDHKIPSHRGTGPSISLIGASLYAMNYDVRPAREADVYRLEFSVGYVHKDEWDDEYPRERSKKYEIQVPMDLEENFTQEKFHEWIALKLKEKEAQRKEACKKKLLELKEQFPDRWEETVRLLLKE